MDRTVVESVRQLVDRAYQGLWNGDASEREILNWLREAEQLLRSQLNTKG